MDIETLQKRRRKVLRKSVLTEKDHARLEKLDKLVVEEKRKKGIIPFEEKPLEEQMSIGRDIISEWRSRHS